MQSTKEVYFHQYCSTCKHRNVNEDEEPCDDCLEHFVNEDSHKPTRYLEDAEAKKKQDKVAARSKKTCVCLPSKDDCLQPNEKGKTT